VPYLGLIEGMEGRSRTMDRTASDILGVPETRARDLFPGDEKAVAREFRRLVKAWHPDRCPDPKAADVVAHLNKLRVAALRKIGAIKVPSQMREFRANDGKLFRFRYNSIHRIDIGEVIVGDNSVAYVFDREFADIAAAEQMRIGGLRFQDEGMRKEMARFLPSPKRAVVQQDATVLVYEKTPDQFLLVDLIRHAGGRIDPRHVAWIVSRMENIASYLCWAGISHGAIDATNLLVSPKYHTVSLVGGWGFATEIGQRPKALPWRTLSALPRLAVEGTPSDHAVDLELLRMTARECLGDAAGGRIVADGSIPQALSAWLVIPPTGTAFEDFPAWEAALARAFGPRRFIPWDVQPAEVYAAAA